MQSNCNDYPYIWAWGVLTGSAHGYIERQVEKAKQDNAPHNAIYKSSYDPQGRWHTFDDIEREDTRAILINYVKQQLAIRNLNLKEGPLE